MNDWIAHKMLKQWQKANPPEVSEYIFVYAQPTEGITESK